MEKTAGGAHLGEKIRSSVGLATYLSENASKEAVGYINMDFRGEFQANVNL